MCRVPVAWNRCRIPTIHRLHQEEEAAGVPQGYIRVVGGAAPSARPNSLRRMGMRDRSYTQIHKSDLGPLERHWTADEMRRASEEAAAITEAEIARVQVTAPLAEQDPASRTKAWDRAKKAAKKQHLQLGVSGCPPFSQLPYFRSDPLPFFACYAVDS